MIGAKRAVCLFPPAPSLGLVGLPESTRAAGCDPHVPGNEPARDARMHQSMATQLALRDPEALTDKMTELRDRLRKQAYLYESPHDFRAGVEAALNAFLREARRQADGSDIDLAGA
jgi:hypothetical protein